MKSVVPVHGQRDFQVVLQALAGKLEKKELNHLSLKNANGKIHASSIVKTQRIQFFISQIQELANLMQDFRSMNLVQLLQHFCQVER